MLARAARRLSQGSLRGLGDALSDAASTSSSGRQLASLRALATGASSGADSSTAAAAAAGGQQAPALGPEEASTSAAAAATQHQHVGGSARQRVPPGHTDFQQRQLLMLFTCNKCNTRAGKAFSKQSYESGVVIVECPGCQNKHLIADHLGWFGQKGTVEEFAAEKGRMVVRKTADGTVELTPEDLLGQSLVDEAEAARAAAAAEAAAGPGGAGAASGS